MPESCKNSRLPPALLCRRGDGRLLSAANVVREANIEPAACNEHTPSTGRTAFFGFRYNIT
jgi:hypothetical protein